MNSLADPEENHTLNPEEPLFMVGCATNSKEGIEMGLGLGFRSSGETSIEVNDSVTTALSSALGIPAIKSSVDDVEKSMNGVSGDVANAKRDIADSVDRIQDAETKIEVVEKEAESASDTAKESKSEVDGIAGAVNDIKVKLQLTQTELERSEEALRKLDEITVQKLKAVTESRLAELAKSIEKGKDDFDTQVDDLLREKGLTEGEIVAFKKATEGLSNESIFALLAAAAGAGGALSRFGKSRAGEKIAQLEKDNAEVKRMIENPR